MTGKFSFQIYNFEQILRHKLQSFIFFIQQDYFHQIQIKNSNFKIFTSPKKFILEIVNINIFVSTEANFYG